MVPPDYLLNILIIHPLTVVFVFTFCGVHTFPWLIVFQNELYTGYNRLDGHPLKHPMGVYKVKSETPIKFKRQFKKLCASGVNLMIHRLRTQKIHSRFGFNGGGGVKTLWLPLSKSANKKYTAKLEDKRSTMTRMKILLKHSFAMLIAIADVKYFVAAMKHPIFGSSVL